MGEESPKPSSAPTRAVFLSYASQDAEAAQRICEALRAAGIEVWFDQSALRGGGVWGQTIPKQIKTREAPSRRTRPRFPQNGKGHTPTPVTATHPMPPLV